MPSLEHIKHLESRSRWITISHEDSDTGPRVGGHAPDGIVPPFVNSATRFFATLELDPGTEREVSVFVSIDWDDQTCYEPSNPSSLWNAVSKLMAADCPLVQCVVHQSTRRSSSPHLASDLDGRALFIAGESPDIVVEPGGELLLPSKIGDRPYYYYGTPSYIQSVHRLLEQGFCLFLQMTFPGFKESPPGLWPFGEYTFHLLAKESGGGIAWHYGWG